MLGAIVGDIVGSRFEWSENKSKEFAFLTPSCTFTDDSIMTIAIARAFILRRGAWHAPDFQAFVTEQMVKMGQRFAYRQIWGAGFYKWFMEESKPYNSCGNGAAMRVSPVGWVASSEEEVRTFSRLVTEVSHNHPEGIKGAEAVAMAVYLARTGRGREEIRRRMLEYYPEIEGMTVKKIRPGYGFDRDGRWITCQGSVPQAIVCFLDATDFEDAVRNAVSLGGDTDTQGAMAGAMAEAYFGISPDLEEKTLAYLTEDMRSTCAAFRLVRHPRIPHSSEGN